MQECSEHALLQRIDEWRIAHMHVHQIESREVMTARGALDKRLDALDGTVSRELFDLLVARVSGLERLLPIVALLSAAIGAGIVGTIVKVLEG